MECLICKEECKYKLSCNHFYHEKCLSKWFESKCFESKDYKCCYCTKDLSKEEIDAFTWKRRTTLIFFDENNNLVRRLVYD